MSDESIWEAVSRGRRAAREGGYELDTKTGEWTTYDPTGAVKKSKRY